MKHPEKKKICALVKNKFHQEEPETFSLLVKKPKYFCGKCGRSASKKSMICKPVKIKRAGASKAE